jgi:hypothetical protein
MTLQSVIGVTMQEEDFGAILGMPTKQQMVKNKIETPHHFQRKNSLACKSH